MGNKQACKENNESFLTNQILTNHEQLRRQCLKKIGETIETDVKNNIDLLNENYKGRIDSNACKDFTGYHRLDKELQGILIKIHDDGKSFAVYRNWSLD